MYEKVNPQHPDKVADRIAGAIVDVAYEKCGGIEKGNPSVAVEVLIGHGQCMVTVETTEAVTQEDVSAVVRRIAGDVSVTAVIVPQDLHLRANQFGAVRCGDNGIFKGCPVTDEQRALTDLANQIYEQWPYDGKYVIHGWKHETHPAVVGDIKADITVCQSNADGDRIEGVVKRFERWLESCYKEIVRLTPTVNPLGSWTGGTEVDCGATNRKLGSDMGDGVTGGGLHGKDLSKADVSVNIWCHLEAQRQGRQVEACCAIGDETVNGIPYKDIVEEARQYIISLGGFERFAEWGLIR